MHEDVGPPLDRLRVRLEAIEKSLQGQVDAIRDASETNRQAQEQTQARLSELRVPEDEKRKANAYQEKSHAVQVIVAVGTCGAFLAAAIYAGISASQLAQMRTATETNTRAVRGAEIALDASQDQLDRTMVQMTTQTSAEVQASKAAKSAADTAEESIKATKSEMEQDRRAWVSISVIPKGPLEFREDSAILPLKLTMGNVGHSPAEFVKPWAKLILGRESPYATCDLWREPLHEKEKNGWTLFPGDSFTKDYPADVTFDGREYLKQFSVTKKSGDFIEVALVVCNDYVLPFDPKTHHQTRQIYAVGRVDPKTHFVMGDFQPLSSFSPISLYLQPGGSAD